MIGWSYGVEKRIRVVHTRGVSGIRLNSTMMYLGVALVSPRNVAT